MFECKPAHYLRGSQSDSTCGGKHERVKGAVFKVDYSLLVLQSFLSFKKFIGFFEGSGACFCMMIENFNVEKRTIESRFPFACFDTVCFDIQPGLDFSGRFVIEGLAF